MRPYGKSSKIRLNIEDNHPQKDEQNWWEDELGSVSKKRARRKAKEEIKKQL